MAAMYDDPRYDHPSDSIPNAAYPDAPYQPGQGQQYADVRPSHPLGLTAPSSFTLSSQQAASSSASLLSPSVTLSHETAPSQWSHDPATGPEDPPPPYAPRQSQPVTQPAAAYSPATSSDGGHFGPMIPLQPIHSVPSASSPHSPSSVHQDFYAQQQQNQNHNHHHPHRPQFHQPPILPYGRTGPASTMSGKPGPLELARQRRRRRIRICILVFGVLLLFIMAIILGIAFTTRHKGSSDSSSNSSSSSNSGSGSIGSDGNSNTVTNQGQTQDPPQPVLDLGLTIHNPSNSKR